jgi:ADP-heptose:LPS heptosyltransferase
MDKAIAAGRRAVELKPQGGGAHFELAEALLISGQFEEGWREYEWRWRIAGVPPLMPAGGKPQWDGAPGRKVVLICDQGFGDTIQFSRYIPQVLARCPEAVIAASREMQPIVRQLSGQAAMTHRWQALAAFDCYCPLSSLPMIFGADAGNIPLAQGYLKPDPEKQAYWKKKLDVLLPPGYRRIALAWAGRPTHGNDANRSITLEHLRPLLDLENTAFISLQRGPAQAQLGRYFGKAPVINLAEDFPEVMAMFAHVDRVVSVDTSLAHLAGAMGVPVSILLAYAPDWRWLLNRADTPWYASATLHRQDRPGGWDSALRQVADLLAREAARA